MTFRFRPSRWLEPVMVLIILGGLVKAALFFIDRDYLPQPFFYDAHDTWMDWFNPAFWAYEPGAYDGWGSIYPPLSFVFLRIFSLGACYANEADAYTVRDCDWVGIVSLHAFWVLNLFLMWKSFSKMDRSTAVWRTLALGFGLPTVSGLERGNLVLVCMTVFMLGFGPILKSARWRWVAVGLALNFKVYLVAGLFARLLRRQWLWFEGALLATILIYLVTFIFFGDGTPQQLYQNITAVSGGAGGFTLTDLWISASYNPFIAVLDNQYLLLAGHLGSRNIDILKIVIPLVTDYGRLTIVVAAVAAWLRPEAVPMSRLTFLGLAFAMSMTETGGYTEPFLIYLLMLERRHGVLRNMAFFAAFTLLIPLDIPVDELPIAVIDSYLAGRSVFVNYYISVGHFIRPLLVIIMTSSMAIVTIREVWADIRNQGWQSRWRYRRDAPLLPHVARPVEPSGPTAP